ncbi:MAG: hypothetical protein GY866_31240 [Proteobacteria bacterium]|nr:hypothetical protein [Pseudomonadota bacterium]
MNPLEKIKLLNSARDNFALAKNPDTSPLEKIKAVNAARDALLKVGAEVKKDRPAAKTPVFDALSKGDYDSLEVMDYIAKVKEAHKEIDELRPLEAPAERYIRKHTEQIGEEIRQELSDAIGEAKTEVDNDDDDEDEEDPKEAKKKEKAEDEKKEKLEDGDTDDDDDDEPVGESLTKLSKRRIKTDKTFFAGSYGSRKIEKVFDHEYFIIGESLEDKSRFYPCRLKDGKIERVLGDEALPSLEDAKARFHDFIGESNTEDQSDGEDNPDTDAIGEKPESGEIEPKDEVGESLDSTGSEERAGESNEDESTDEESVDEPDRIGEASADEGTVSDAVPPLTSPGQSVSDEEEEDEDEETEI